MDRRGIVILTSVEFIQVVLKDVNKQRRQKLSGRSCSQVKKDSCDYFTVTMKPAKTFQRYLYEPLHALQHRKFLNGNVSLLNITPVLILRRYVLFGLVPAEK